MELKIDPIKIEIDSYEYLKLINAEKEFHNAPLLLEKNENSDLVLASKPITQEFFEKVFSQKGPYWSIYNKLGFASTRQDSSYAVFLNEQMYFIKNIEYRYMNNIGAELSLDLHLQENLLLIRKNFNFSNLLLLLSIPFDAAKQVKRKIELGFLANECIKKFEEFRKKSLEYYDYYSVQQNIKDPVKTARECLNLAVESLTFSNMALLCYNLKIKLRPSETISLCEAETLSEMANKADFDSVKKRFGFYSLAPYDISEPRFREDIEDLRNYGFPKPPQNYQLKWRENSKYLCARYLDIIRMSLRIIGKKSGLNDLVFYLKTSELEKSDALKKSNLEKKKKIFEESSGLNLPPKIVFHGGKFYRESENSLSGKNFIARAVSASACKIVCGPAIHINSLKDYSRFKRGSIIISKTLSPNLSILFNKALGVISENGGALSHAALIAREMEIPCLVQAHGASQITEGEIVQLNGITGDVKILDKSSYKPDENYPVNRNSTPKIISKRIEEERIKINANIKDSGRNFLWLSEPNLESYGVGPKALNLSVLSKFFNVPPAFCITGKVLIEIAASIGIDKFNEQLKSLEPDNIESIEKISKSIKTAITGYKFREEFLEELKSNLKKLNSKSYAVRSSSAFEDTKETSFAGQLDSFLDITDFEELKKAVKGCWASFYNTRAIVYRLENNMAGGQPNVTVIIEEMVVPNFSGVMFTRSPNDANSIHLEAVQGSCENLVSGKVSPNSYSIDKKSLLVSPINEIFPIDASTIKNILDIGLKIEKLFKSPQDIEWLVDKNKKIWILQSRPITAFSSRRDL